MRTKQCKEDLSPVLNEYDWNNDEDIDLGDSCRITCTSKRKNATGEPYYSSIFAKDGIPCTEGWNSGLCISGKCHLISCDGKLDNSKRNGFKHS